jgi:hypothetical protein
MSENHARIVYYICRDDHFGVVKIGTTVNLPKRFRRYETSRPGINWTIIGVEYGDLESARHRQFSKSRIIGEWFWMTPDLAKHIHSLNYELIEELLP